MGEVMFEAEALDREWILLVQIAKDLGLTKEDIRQFLMTTNVENGE